MVARLIHLAALVMIGVTSACTDDIVRLECRDLEAEVVDMENGALIKITGARVVRRSVNELVCSGTGIYSDNTDIPIRYRAYIDEDHEIMVAYNTMNDSHDERETDAEIERLTSAVNQMVDETHARAQ